MSIYIYIYAYIYIYINVYIYMHVEICTRLWTFGGEQGLSLANFKAVAAYKAPMLRWLSWVSSFFDEIAFLCLIFEKGGSIPLSRGFRAP